jgi:septum formation protein
MHTHVVLASSSPYRRELLDRLRVPYTVMSPEIDETPTRNEKPRATAVRLAEAKARAVGARCPGALVIGSDQVAELEGAAIGKPGTHENALLQLLAMRAKQAVFHTALCLLDSRTGEAQVDETPTTVHFRPYSEAQAEAYLRQEQPYDCAGSAKIERLGIALVERVMSEDPTALIGLPLIALTRMLERAGVRIL